MDGCDMDPDLVGFEDVAEDDGSLEYDAEEVEEEGESTPLPEEPPAPRGGHVVRSSPIVIEGGTWIRARAVLCCAVLCCAVLCCAVLCCAVLCCAVLCCTVLYCAVLCCAVCSLCRGPIPLLPPEVVLSSSKLVLAANLSISLPLIAESPSSPVKPPRRSGIPVPGSGGVPAAPRTSRPSGGRPPTFEPMSAREAGAGAGAGGPGRHGGVGSSPAVGPSVPAGAGGPGRAAASGVMRRTNSDRAMHPVGSGAEARAKLLAAADPKPSDRSPRASGDRLPKPKPADIVTPLPQKREEAVLSSVSGDELEEEYEELDRGECPLPHPTPRLPSLHHTRSGSSTPPSRYPCSSCCH